MSYDDSREQIFLYHAYANGVGGFIERNGQTLAIPSIGGAALSSAGGKAFRETGPFSWAPPFEPKPPEGFSISVERITTKLWTEENDSEWVSNAEVRVYGFNLCERVKIGLMVNRLTSRHPKGIRREELPDQGQPHISYEGSQYWNVLIDDEPVHVTIDRDVDAHKTHDRLKNHLKRRAATASPVETPRFLKDLKEKFQSDKLTRCSMVSEIRHSRACEYAVDLTDADDPKNRRKNLGRVFFGEMLVGDDLKHVNMIRWDLGCTTTGGGTGGSTDMNGVPMP
jgi:hypothetical protein